MRIISYSISKVESNCIELNFTWNYLISTSMYRFCGKFSKLEGHSVSDCIHLTGVKFGKTILTPEQEDILDSTQPFVYLSGKATR